MRADRHAPFSLLDSLYADREMLELFSQDATIDAWLTAEVALAQAQARTGAITQQAADAISDACVLDNIDSERLWAEARNVGYPILPLVRMVAARLPTAGQGRLHLGATTQDIMDTGLALQLSRALDRLEELCAMAGDALADRVRRHGGTLMPARTHAQQAVPTTLGAKLAVYLGELTRHRSRLRELRPRLCIVSLFGAAGTSAAYGPDAPALRREVAHRLDLEPTDVPWHSARDAIAEFGFVCAALGETCARFAREVVDLARTEIGELHEAGGHHRGASSTMPQKANPILSEATIGFAVTATTTAQGLLRAMEAGHERAAGEWHVEWAALPRVAVAAASAVSLLHQVVVSAVVDEHAMRRNLEADGGLLLSEAYMIRLAPRLGREVAHDLVYAAAEAVRANGTSLLAEVTARDERAAAVLDEAIAPADYVGDVATICDSALAAWSEA